MEEESWVVCADMFRDAVIAAAGPVEKHAESVHAIVQSHLTSERQTRSRTRSAAAALSTAGK